MKRNMVIHIVVLYLLFSCGCALISNPVTGEAVSPARVVSEDTQKWTWGRWMFHVNESHDSIEAIPVRGGEWHLNVTKFLETQPCQNCLNIGAVIPQGDGTVKVKVSLTHPFPGVPKYTGFDVRGIVIFPATRHWESEGLQVWTGQWDEIYNFTTCPCYFSCKGDGGAQLLNADGYSFYFWPGLDIGTGYEAPIFNYQQGKYASPNTPDSTINPYLSFNDGSVRRMFKASDLISRDYHIHMPDGEFSFGYIVLASWVQPTAIPVTNPELDFPVEANSESVVNIQFEQYLPLDPDDPYLIDGGTWAKVTFNMSPHISIDLTYIIAPDILYWLTDESQADLGIAHRSHWDPVEISPGVFEFNYTCGIDESESEHPYINGKYLALVVLINRWKEPDPGGASPATFIMGPSFQLVEVELAASGS